MIALVHRGHKDGDRHGLPDMDSEPRSKARPLLHQARAPFRNALEKIFAVTFFTSSNATSNGNSYSIVNCCAHPSRDTVAPPSPRNWRVSLGRGLAAAHHR